MQGSTTAIRRLSDFLHSIASKMDGRTFLDALAKELGIENTNSRTLYEAYLDFLELLDDAIDESNNISSESQRNKFLAPIEALRKSFRTKPPHNSANTFGVNDTVLTQLDYAAEYLSGGPEQLVSPDLLKELNENANSMIEQILDSDLPKYLKSRLVEILKVFQSSIITYQLNGVSGLRKATEEMLGILVFNNTELKQATQNSAVSKKTIHNLLGFIEKASKVVEFANKLKELAAPIIKFLLPIDNNPTVS